MKTIKEVLEKNRQNNPSVPHWITMKDAEKAVRDYLKIISKDKVFNKKLIALVDQFTGGKEVHTPLLIDRICKEIVNI